MATNAFYSNAAHKTRPEAGLPPLPIPLSSYSAYRPESVLQNESPFTPNFEKKGPFYRSQTQDSNDSESQFFNAGNEQNDSSGRFADTIPLRPHHDQVPFEGELPQKMDPDLDKTLPVPISQRRRKRRREPEKKGFFRGRVPWVVYIFTLVQLTVFIVEMVKNALLTGTPIEIHPQVNPMLGPSIYVLINMGARYVPCMRSTDGIQNSPVEITWPCPNTTSSDLTSPMNQCQLSDLCGFSPVPNPYVGDTLDTQPQPNQWFRFIIPIFLHAGIVHIAFNMLLQLTLGREMEKEIGSLRFLLVYLSSGIFGFVMGGNFAPNGIASTGCSGSLFGIIAVMLLDLLYTWKGRKSPGKELAFIILDIVISFVLGLLPGLDNFSHIGGFLMGLVLGICILHSPNILRERVGSKDLAYGAVTTKPKKKSKDGVQSFMKDPVGFFKARKPLWWAWWAVRVAALVGVLVCFVVLLNNFYKYRTTCSWCKYLSCLPVNNWCDVGNIQIQNPDANTTMSRRDLFGVKGAVQIQDLVF
ncbi:hypothetical protein MMC18_006046 [Xylographa bjoerkii]|nr:hypothetical protein [Xylographa bjoerkii]